MSKPLSGFEKLKAKHSELNGGGAGDRFVWRVDPTASDGQQFHILNPHMVDERTRDEVAVLNKDFKDGVLLPSEYAADMLDIYIDDQERDDFESLAASGEMSAMDLLNMIIKEFQSKRSPTRRTSSRMSRQ